MQVYFIASKDHKHRVKIGYAADVDKRLSELQIGSPLKLSVVMTIPCESKKHAQAIEKQLHIACKPHHLHGEWFALKGVKKVMRSIGFKMASTAFQNEFYQELGKDQRRGKLCPEYIGVGRWMI